MAKSCKACDDLRQYAPDFILNGVTDSVCTSLKNNTGFNPANSRTDCQDLDDANDCLIGNMEDEIDAYEVCDWKEYMHKFVPNVWTVIKAIICSLCGLWTTFSNILNRLTKLECVTDTLSKGVSIKIGEDSTDGSYVVAGKGISFLSTGTGAGESQVTFSYVAGGLVRIQGSLLFDVDDFTDGATCYNFDNGTNIRHTKSRKGNTLWNNTTGTCEVMVGGGELLYEIRIKKSQYPMIRSILSGIGGPTGGGAYQVNLVSFSEGEYAYGQHGSCNSETGEPSASGYDGGHIVEPGYLYVQARMVNISYLIADGRRYSPRGFVGIRLNENEIEC